MARSSLLLLALCAVAPSLASAQRLRVAVLPVEGPQGDKATAQIIKVVRQSAEVILAPEWDVSAKKLFAPSRSPADLAAVAADLSLQVVITGKVKKVASGWELSVGVRHGATGKAAVKLKYPLKGPRLDPATLQALGDDVAPALDVAAAGDGSGDAGETPDAAGATEAPPVAEEKEKPLTVKPQPEVDGERPEWAPFVDASVGFALAGRNFGFDQAGTPSFKSTVTPGIVIDATGYPLASMGGGSRAAASGLGIGATYATNVWSDVAPCYGPSDASGNCTVPTVDRFATREYAFEGGVRYRWNILRRLENAPWLLASLQYGQHVFAIQRRNYVQEGERDIGPPNVAYSYVSIGLGLRLGITRRVAATLGFNYHAVLDTGAIQTSSEWGAGSAWGLRAGLNVDVRIWKGIYARVGGQVERFGISFNQPPQKNATMPPCPCGTTGGAADTFYGGTLSVGYTY